MNKSNYLNLFNSILKYITRITNDSHIRIWIYINNVKITNVKSNEILTLFILKYINLRHNITSSTSFISNIINFIDINGHILKHPYRFRH